VQQADALLFEFGDHEIEAGKITARPVVAGNEAHGQDAPITAIRPVRPGALLDPRRMGATVD
jgi:hypothetical protein